MKPAPNPNDSWIVRRIRRFRRTVVPRLPLPASVALRRLRTDNEDRVTRDDWQHLADIDELPRYSIIRGYCDFFRPQGSVLDIGCGTGILQERLAYGSYLGVDLFEDAIDRAAARNDERTRFVQADAAAFEPPDTYDLIIFNECLIYMDEPAAVVHRYENYLAEGGLVIVSMWDQLHRGRKIFRQLLRGRTLEARTRVSNPRNGMAWTVTAHRRPGS